MVCPESMELHPAREATSARPWAVRARAARREPWRGRRGSSSAELPAQKVRCLVLVGAAVTGEGDGGRRCHQARRTADENGDLSNAATPGLVPGQVNNRVKR